MKKSRGRTGVEKGKVEFMENILMALQIMWKGMAGIFVAVLIIMVIVYLLGKIGK